MSFNIKNAFDTIRADDALISKTEGFLIQELQKRTQKRRVRTVIRPLAALSACVAAICVIFALRLYNTPDAFVSIDVNPSFELTLNRFNRVITAEGYNAEGQALLDRVSVRGKKSDDAITSLISTMELGGYLTPDGLVSVTVHADNLQVENTLCMSLENTIEYMLLDYQAQPALEVFPVTQDIHDHAHSNNMTPARYLAILELMEVDETASLEEYTGSSISQIRSRTQMCRDEHTSGSHGGQMDAGNSSGSQADNGYRSGESHGSGHGGGHH